MTYALGVLACILFALSPQSAHAQGFPELTGPDSPVVMLWSRGLPVCLGVVVAKHAVLTAQHCLGVELITRAQDTSSDAARVVGHSIPDLPGVDAVLLWASRPLDVVAISRRTRFDIDPPRRVWITGYKKRALPLPELLTFEISLRGWGCHSQQASLRGCSDGLELAIGRNGGLDTCQGDSGGPVVERTTEGYRLVAITSRAVRNSLLRCGDGGIYVRVDALEPWLSYALEQRQPRGPKRAAS